MPEQFISTTDVIANTERWLEKAVIGLNLCPFAKAVQVKQQIRFTVSEAHTPEELLVELIRELEVLAEANPEKIETSLLIHPYVLTDFLDYNDFLDVADAALHELNLEGIVQIASFHPDYQFADTESDDIENFTNRSPYPTLHLLREESIDKAVEAFPDADAIYEKNIQTMRDLGHEGWRKLFSAYRKK
ncbi:DUF1415 domain-containing protein [Undibacterium sp. 5I1]|uniref:DUF1415 domain-containing protein n=1 Tax=unclassified Undibacterium TaxID=2630295 RepID=UPI002AB4E72F|nr:MULTISPECIES: DUF1415 domain-containing protein [unclassified Undibacterium]MDY7537442.1 DUF1415 domain-containing protein [Undibacterium sp. 5I1]MEB0232074.1 DUF1415 domain-containing protein [Undibacterium sp. 10I3]MEB0259363.1 DUF1415 domain-containing protein [Undibacterium sp. 5I1]